MDLKHLLIHLADCTDESEIVDAIVHFSQIYKNDPSEESKEKLIVAMQSFMMKHIMEQENKDSDALIEDIEKFQKANRLFKFENN